MHRRLTACVSLAILCYGEYSCAQSFDDSFPGEAASARDSAWYGWQTLAADGTSLLAVPALSLATDESAPLVLGLVGYLLVPPVIHAQHDNDGAATASVLIRVAVPLLSAAIVGAATDCPRSDGTTFELDFCPLPQQLKGAYGGMVTAALFDAAILAYGDDKPDDALWMSVSPSLTREHAEATLTLGGAF